MAAQRLTYLPSSVTRCILHIYSVESMCVIQEVNKISAFLLGIFFMLLRIRFSTDLKDLSFLNRCPGLVWIVRLHLLSGLQGVRSEIFLKNLALLVDDKGHYSRLAPV